MEREENFGTHTAVARHIPIEIAIDGILSRLPLKCVYKFRSVCKLWDSLPCDSRFVELYNRRSATAPTFIVLSYKAEGDHSILSFYSFNTEENGNTSKLLSTIPLELDLYSMEPSCSGLVCFSSLVGQDIYVCNPSTCEVLQLPNIPKVHGLDTKRTSPCRVAGFGFDESSKEYKVLCAYQDFYENNWKCFVYTLGSGDGKWRRLDDIPYEIQPMQGACFNGAVHWLIENDYYDSPDGILAFSFEDEKYELFPLPSCEMWESYMDFSGLHSSVYLKALGGHLRLVTTLDGSDAGFYSLRFWTLTDYEKRVWTFDFSVKFHIFDECMKVHLPIPVDIQNGKVLISSGRRLYVHDLKEITTAEIDCDFPGEDAVNNAKCFQPNHVERLVSVYGNY